MTKKQEGSIHFNGINGLRFLAALSVIITHIELLKNSFGLPNKWTEPLVFNLGGLGVYFFFVLSGFLITYLLLAEKKKFGQIDIKAFYIRRVLRIWPLYYLIVFIGFFILPYFSQIRISYLQQSFEEHYSENLLLFILMLPNLALSLFQAVPHIGHLWSIGVEEQFYLLWPLLIAYRKNTLKSIVGIFFMLIVIKSIVLILGYRYSSESWYMPLKMFTAMAKFECMAIGGLGAWLLFHDHPLLSSMVLNKIVLAISIILIPVLIYTIPEFLQDGVHIIFSIIFLIIIINVSTRVSFLDNGVLSYLGKISYGIYMYHFMFIPVVVWFIRDLQHNLNIVAQNVLIYTFSILFSIMISAISYKFFERPFIMLKHRFTKIKSESN